VSFHIEMPSWQCATVTDIWFIYLHCDTEDAIFTFGAKVPRAVGRWEGDGGHTVSSD